VAAEPGVTILLMQDRLLAGLNAPQKEAVTHAGGPLLVLAAPDAKREWAGQALVMPEDADARA